MLIIREIHSKDGWTMLSIGLECRLDLTVLLA